MISTTPLQSDSPVNYGLLRTIQHRPLRIGGTAEELLADLMASGCSLSVIMLAHQMVDGDKATAEVLKGINHLRDLRQAHQERVVALKALKAYLSKNKGEIKLPKEGKEKEHLLEAFQKNPALAQACGFDQAVFDGISAGSGLSEQNKYLRDCLQSVMQKHSYRLDGGRVYTETSGSIATGASISAEEVEVAIAEHERAQQSVDSQKQLLNMRLQELVQQKQRLVTLATNIADAEHRSQDAIAKNTRV